MFVVTNRMKTKPGFAKRMAPRFTKPGALQQMEGFVKVEVLVSQNQSESDELNVNMYWDTLEHFSVWRNSDAFKEAHNRPASGSSEPQQESPIVSSEIIIAEVASVLEPSPQK